MRRLNILIAWLLSSLSCLTASGPVTYKVTVNTSSLAGTMGSLDFNFNPGPLATQTASVQVLTFDGALSGSPALVGEVSGALPTTLTFNNGSAFNDYFQGIKFGSTITFNLSLYGPALSSPNGVSTSGSTFAFSLFSDTAGTVPALTTDTTNGFAFLIAVNLDGTTTVTNLSPQTSIGNSPPSCQLSSIVPGPPTQLVVAMQDTSSGLRNISVVEDINASINVPAFTSGTTLTVSSTATKLNQNQSSNVGFVVTTMAGLTTSCDPVDFRLELDGATEQHVFRSLPALEHYVRIVNGAPGVHQITFLVNGHKFLVPELQDGENSFLDIGSAMLPEASQSVVGQTGLRRGVGRENNNVVMHASGASGSSVYVLIGDSSIEGDFAGQQFKYVDSRLRRLRARLP